MTKTERKKLPFWGTILTIIGIAVLCSLGTWQLYRLQWKEDILTKLEAAQNEDITEIDFDTLTGNNFAYGIIEGRFLFDKSILLGYKVKDGKSGNDLIVPIETAQGTLLVNMGWNNQDWDLETHFLKTYQDETIRFTGLVRKPEWNAFTPDNQPDKNLWYKADIQQIANVKELKAPIPFMMYADFASRKFDAQFPNNEKWEPNNNHLQYAIFWFAMALAMAVVYVLRFLKNKD